MKGNDIYPPWTPMDTIAIIMIALGVPALIFAFSTAGVILLDIFTR